MANYSNKYNDYNSDNPKYFYPKIKKSKNKRGPLKKFYVVTISPEPYSRNEIELNTYDENSIQSAIDFYNMILKKHHNDRHISLVEEVRENGLCLHDLYRTIKCHIPNINARNIRE